MTVEYVLAHIKRRMQEIGCGDSYVMRWKNFQLDIAAVLKIDAQNQFYFLVTPVDGVEIKSKFGYYNLQDTAISEMQYEHKGKIEITNNSGAIRLLSFIQVTPSHNQNNQKS